jgi:hypothetical protein
MLLDGAPAPHLIRPDATAKDALILTMTGIGQRVIVHGTVDGAERGTLLLQKL